MVAASGPSRSLAPSAYRTHGSATEPSAPIEEISVEMSSRCCQSGVLVTYLASHSDSELDEESGRRPKYQSDDSLPGLGSAGFSPGRRS